MGGAAGSNCLVEGHDITQVSGRICQRKFVGVWEELHRLVRGSYQHGGASLEKPTQSCGKAWKCQPTNIDRWEGLVQIHGRSYRRRG